MRLEYNFYVYITANVWHTIYVGVSNDLFRRIWEHKTKAVPGFTSRYGVDRLVYFEHTTDVRAAIAREKQLKVWRRAKKLALIHSMNPEWKDLAADWFTAEQLTNDELRSSPSPLLIPHVLPGERFAAGDGGSVGDVAEELGR